VKRFFIAFSIVNKRRRNMIDGILSRKAVMEITGRSSASLWRDVRDGRFPAPRQTGVKRIGWLKSEVQTWLESRPLVTSAKKAG
jgi:prophage regulatory protein